MKIESQKVIKLLNAQYRIQNQWEYWMNGKFKMEWCGMWQYEKYESEPWEAHY